MMNDSLRRDPTALTPMTKTSWKPMSLRFVGRVGEVTLAKTAGAPDGVGDAVGPKA